MANYCNSGQRFLSVMTTANLTINRPNFVCRLLPPQLRKLPPLAMVVGILDKSALKMAEKAALRANTEQKLTPFAAKEFEAQRNNSRA